MRRRDFLHSAGSWLMALAGMGSRPARADERSATFNRAETGSSVTLFLSGDVMTGRGVDQVLPHPGDPQIHESYMKSAQAYVDIAEEASGPIPRRADYRYIWGDALDEWDAMAPDLRIINLETAVTTSDEHWPRKGIHYRMNPENIPVLTAAGIDCCVLANNHVLDWGYPGLEETLGSLRAAGLVTAGAGRDLGEAGTPAMFDLEHRGRLIVIAAASPSSGVPSAWAAGPGQAGVNFIPDYSPASAKLIARQVEAVKRPGDLLVLSIHWGGNWGYRIPAKQQEFARELIDRARVDVIHGHSSHHPRAIEVYKGRPILYGCGDFINDYEGIGGREQYRGELSLMYFLTIDKPSGELRRLEMRPMRMRRFRLERASAADSSWLAATMDRESSRFGSRVELLPGGSLIVHPGSLD